MLSIAVSVLLPKKSVQVDNEQLNLFNEAEITSDILVPESELVEIEKHFRKRRNMVNEKNCPIICLLPDDEQICPE